MRHRPALTLAVLVLLLASAGAALADNRYNASRPGVDVPSSGFFE